jgi:sec-independent protein translocase protein TatB
MLVIGVVVLVFVGPDRIPELMSTAGKYYGCFRRLSDDLRRAFNAEVARHEADRRRSELETRRLSAEAKRQAEREAAAASEGAAEEPAAHGADAPGVDSSDPPQAGEQVPARPFPGGAAARPPRFAPDAVPATEPSEPEPVADPQEPS